MPTGSRHLAPTAGINAGQGKVVTVAADDRVILWDGASRLPIAEATHAGLASSCDISRSGRYVVTAGGDGSARIWTVPGLGLRSVLRDRSPRVLSAVISPNERRVAIASLDRYARIFSMDGRLLRTVFGQGSAIVSVEWTSEGGHLVIGTSDATLRVWDSTTGLLICALRLDGENPVTVAAARWNAFYAGDFAGRIVFFADGVRYPQPGHEAAVCRVRYYAAGRMLVSADDDRTVRFWNCRPDGTLVPAGETMAPQPVVPSCFAGLDQNTWVFGTTDGRLAVFERSAGIWRLEPEGDGHE
jgi:toxoflavin biosynthesis protein ToxC